MIKYKLILFIILIINIVYCKAEYIDSNDNIRVSQAINFTGCNTLNCNKTGSLNFSSYSGVYLKDIVCSGGKSFDSPYNYNTGTLLQLIISPNSSITGNWLNLYYNPRNVYNTQTFLNSVFTGTTIYWKVTNFYNTGDLINTFAPLLCYVNYTPLIYNNKNMFENESDLLEVYQFEFIFIFIFILILILLRLILKR